MLRQKNNIPVKQPLKSLHINTINLSEEYSKIIKEEINVKELLEDNYEILKNKIGHDNNYVNGGDVSFYISLNPELIREGKQRELSREIKDKRKELGLISSDFVILNIQEGRLELIDEAYKKEMKIVEVKVSDLFSITKA
jgi:aminopeptidase-like protein